MKRLLIPLLTLAILGAGCANAPAPTPEPGANPPSASTPPASTPPTGSTTTPAPSPAGSSQLTPAATDATWHTYASAALGFSFMTPTKGRYAPQWEVKFVKDTDAAVTGGCYAVSGGEVGTPTHVSAGAQAFCHTSASEGAAGSTYFTDAYATAIGHTVVVIQFTKQVTNGGIIPNCTAQYSSVSTACVPFVQAEYEAALDGIVGTFQLTK